MHVIKQPLPPAPPANFEAQVLAQWNALYDAHNEELESMFEIQSGVERFDLIQTLHACKQEEGKPVRAYVLKMLPKKAKTPQVMAIRSGKIQKANKKSLKAKGKGKYNGKRKDKQVYILKPKNPKPSAKEHRAKDDACHHCKEVGHWKSNCPVYLAELLKKKKQVGSASSSGERKLKQVALYLYMGNGVRAPVEAVGSYDLVLPNGLVTCLDNCHYAPTITRGVVSVHHLVENGFVHRFTNYEISVSKNDVLYFNVIPGKMTRKPFPRRAERASDLLGIIHNDVLGKEFKDYLKDCGIVNSLPSIHTTNTMECLKENCTLLDMVRSMMNLTTLPLSFWDYALESATRILNMVPTKKALVKRDTPDKLQQRSVKCIFIGYPNKTKGYYFYFAPENKIVVARYAEFFKKSVITQEVSGRAVDLEKIQKEDTSPSEITSQIPMEVEGFKPPQVEVIPIRRSVRTHRAPNRLCLNVEADEHSLGDLNEPTSYKAAMLDPESKKWLDAMNAEI
ncbi:retrotransposon protein, putative, ty1-copia subclass [Tanacetum coccineum]